MIARQAMAGAPWRQICAGPMQLNNITEAEVEAEVKRIIEAKKIPSGLGTPTPLPEAFAAFEREFTRIVKEISEGIVLDCSDCEKARLALLLALNMPTNEPGVVEFVNFLTNDVTILIEQLTNPTDGVELQLVAQRVEQAFEKYKPAIVALMARQSGQNFWESTI